MKYTREKINKVTKEYGNKVCSGLGYILTKNIGRKTLVNLSMAALISLSPIYIPTQDLYAKGLADKGKETAKKAKEAVKNIKNASQDDVAKQVGKFVGGVPLGVYRGFTEFTKEVKEDKEIKKAIEKIKSYIDPELRKGIYAEKIIKEATEHEEKLNALEAKIKALEAEDRQAKGGKKVASNSSKKKDGYIKPPGSNKGVPTPPPKPKKDDNLANLLGNAFK